MDYLERHECANVRKQEVLKNIRKNLESARVE